MRQIGSCMLASCRPAVWRVRAGTLARKEICMHVLRVPTLVVLALVAGLTGLAVPAFAQDRVRTKEVVVGLGAEPRTMLAVTIVDWTTNNMLEHIYDRLLDRDAKTFKPKPMLAESWRHVN